MNDRPDSFPIFNRVLDHADLMDRMMIRCGANPLISIRRDGGTAWLEARSRCIECVADKLCRQWLDADPRSSPESADFICANRSFIDSCRTRDASS
ncbi:MAG: DUF6455 family protein [Hyphomicrobiaceae bacterium]